MIKFTVAIPCYKDKFLAEAIDSILNQSLQDFEIVIVNDASPFGIDAVIAKYDDPRIKYFKNKTNCGAINVVNNWNICLRHAEGEYVILMGDDDKLETNCLEVYLNLINTHPNIDVFHGRTTIINEQSKFVKLLEARPEWESMRSLIWHRINGRQQYIGDFLFKKRWLEENGGFIFFPLAWGTDDMTAFLAAKNKGIISTNTPVFCYRSNQMSISMSSFTDIKLDCNKEYNKQILKLIDTSPILDSTDYLYSEMIKANIFKKFYKKSIHLFALDFLSIGHFKTIRSFIRNKKKHALPDYILLMAFIEYLKIRRAKI